MMATKNIEKELADIREKLDFVVAQLQAQQRRQQERDELKHDVTLIGRDIFQTVVTELDEVAPYFDTRDLVHLLKKLLRNVRNLNRMMDQLESVMDFLDDAKPIQKEAFGQLLHKLDELDRKGYFDFFREASKIVDTIVTCFTVEDVRLLRENITSILLTVKNMTQPEMLGAMNNALGFYRKMDIEVEKDVTFREILRELKDPEVKRGLFFMLEFVKSMANTNGSGISTNEKKPIHHPQTKKENSHGNRNISRKNR